MAEESKLEISKLKVLELLDPEKIAARKRKNREITKLLEEINMLLKRLSRSLRAPGDSKGSPPPSVPPTECRELWYVG